MYAYVDRLTDFTPAFPAAAFTPREIKNAKHDGFTVTGETGTVPASADFEGKRRLSLNYQPRQQVGFTITVGGTARTIIPYGETPTSGQVAVSFELGLLDFHSSDAGLSVVINYTAKGSVLMAQLFVLLQKELAAVQAELLAAKLSRTYTFSFPGMQVSQTASNREVRLAAPAGWKCVFAQVVHADASPSDATTTIRVSNSVVGASGGGVVSIDATVAQGAYFGTEATGTIAFASAGTLHLFVQSAGKHQHVQVAVRMERGS